MAAMQVIFSRVDLYYYFYVIPYISNMPYVVKTYNQENKSCIFTKNHLQVVLFTFLFVFLVTYWLWKVERLYYFAQINQITTRLQVCKAKKSTSSVSRVDWCCFPTTVEARIELHSPCRLPINIWKSSMTMPCSEV
jgi:hypothetical protein